MLTGDLIIGIISLIFFAPKEPPKISTFFTSVGGFLDEVKIE